MTCCNRNIAGEIAVDELELENLTVTDQTIVNDITIEGTLTYAGPTDFENLSCTTLTVDGTTTLNGLTANRTVVTDGLKRLSTIANTGTGLNVLQSSPTLTTPNIGAATGTSLNVSGTMTAATANIVSSMSTPVATITNLNVTQIDTVLAANRPVFTNASSILTTNNITGSGNSVLATSPTLTTPNIGAATGTSLTTSGKLVSNSTEDASSTSTGAIQAPNGGISCGLDAYIGDNLRVVGSTMLSSVTASIAAHVTSLTDSTSSITGSITTLGGVGVSKNIYSAANIVGLNQYASNAAYSKKIEFQTGSTGPGQPSLLAMDYEFDSPNYNLVLNKDSDFAKVRIENLELPFVYETGTFTPTLMAANPADDASFSTLIHPTYLVQIGKYTRFGNNLTIYVDLQWDNLTTPNGINLIGVAIARGVPYTLETGASAMYSGIPSATFTYNWWNMEPVSLGGIDDRAAYSFYDEINDRFIQYNWEVNETVPVIYRYVVGTGPISVTPYRILYTMHCLIAE